MQDIVMLVGFPASGKSSLVKNQFADYTHLNRDKKGGTILGLIPDFHQAIENGENIVLDNTFPTADSRRDFIHVAQNLGVPIRCIVMDTSIEDAQVNACRRMIQRRGGISWTPEDSKKSGDPNDFPIVVLYKYRKSFEPPIMGEGFTEIRVEPFHREWGKDYTNKAVLLDFDGTLRKTKSGAKFPCSPDDVELLNSTKVVNVLNEHIDQGFQLLGVSNQSGIAKNQLSYDDAVDCFNRTIYLLKKAGLKGDIEYMFCQHRAAPISCYCRKPSPGIGVHFIEKYHLCPDECIMVGDMTSDRTFATRCGFKYRDAAVFFK